MSQPSIEQTLTMAIQYHQEGRMSDAERLYRMVLALYPQASDVWNLLGMLAGQSGRIDEAVEYLERAIAISPAKTDYYLNLGKAHLEKGQFAAAATVYRKVIDLHPTLSLAHNGLGIALRAEGKRDEAINSFHKALRLDERNATIYVNLGSTLRDKGQLDEAIAAYRQALHLQPDDPGARNNIAAILLEKGQFPEAIATFRAAIQRQPDFALAHYNLGVALFDSGEIGEAITAFRRAIQLQPQYPDAFYRLGRALAQHSQLEEAIVAYQKALQLKPAWPEAHHDLGMAQMDSGRLDRAILSFQKAIQLQPGSAFAYCNLGNALRNKKQLDEAIAAYQQFIHLAPDSVDGYINLGNALKDAGRLDDAIASYRRAMVLLPTDVVPHSNLVYLLPFHPSYGAQAILDESLRWADRHASPLGQRTSPHRNDPSPDRKLRIGYVSPDFRDHCQSLFTIPLMRNHNHDQFIIFCYGDIKHPDNTTAGIRQHADVWRTTAGLSDQQLTELIEADQIDILVDLSLHMADNRLLAFARKPAPVQITWLGYPGTTGLSAIDYRFTDPYLDPPGENDECYAERSIRLPETFWCYESLTSKVDIHPSPVLRNGFVTFGCLNNFCKLNDRMLQIWAKVIKVVAESKLILLASEGAHRQHVLDMLEREGIASNRVEFISFKPRLDYMKLYNNIDISLDTLPYNGHTTSLDAFWMGVPVITLVGNTVVGRAGLSQLSNLDLKQFIAQTPEQFVRIAIDLAGNIEQLRDLRTTLRDRMCASPLMDAPRFARNIETLYRQLWKKWCSSAKNAWDRESLSPGI